MVSSSSGKFLARLVRENQGVLGDLVHITLIIGQDEEEHFVLDDRTAEAGAELIAVGIVLAAPCRFWK